METPRDALASVRAFLAVGERLAALGLSAPRVLAARPEAGLLLLEDLGDDLLARVAEARPGEEPALYEAAVDVLVALRGASAEGLPRYDADAMARATDLAASCYAGRSDAPWIAPLRSALVGHAGPADTLILRDYHAENLVWRPERAGPARMGLLDFQDAMRGPAAYDLASLIRDARRDVSAEAASAAVARFAARTETPSDRLDAALAVLGVQRNLRLLGIFARLAARGRPHYLAFLPRVWGQLVADLAHPACAAMRAPALAALPPPVAPGLAAVR
jgi:aminoglycoside/choline kinase family phosphotransferase